METIKLGEHLAGRRSQGDYGGFGTGDGFEYERAAEEENRLCEHLGETVALVGGGGPGARLVRLVAASMQEYDGGYKVKATVEPLGDAPPHDAIGRLDQFEPWMDSWKIYTVAELS